MGLRLSLMNFGLRAFVRPKLRKTGTPEQAERDFARAARKLFRHPPYLTRLERRLNGVPVHWLRTPRVRQDQVILYIHGGAYFSGSGETHAGMAARLGKLAGTQVVIPDYRLLQEAPFPAAFEDVIATCEGLRGLGFKSDRIALAGDSAGGGLALALLADLLARGDRPAALYAMSPWVDLTLSGDTVQTPAEVLLPYERMAEVVELYSNGTHPDDPRLSPLFADWTDPPPVLIQVGTEEALKSDSDRMAEVLRTAGGEVTLEHWPDVFHVWQIMDGWLPEARAALRTGGRFLQTSFDSANR